MNDAEAMSAPPPPPASYAARAFWLQYNLIGLGGCASFSLASASPNPLIGGALAELLWLLVGSNLGPVRRWLDRREVFMEEPRLEPVAPASVSAPPSLPPLDREYANRLATLDRALSEIHSLAGPRADPVFRRAVARLDAIQRVFRSTCEAQQGIAHFLAAAPEAALKAEVARMEQALGTEKDLGIKMSIRQALVLAKRRVEQRVAMTADFGALSLRLETIERAVAHLFTQGRALGGTQKLAAEIDAVVAEIGAGV